VEGITRLAEEYEQPDDRRGRRAPAGGPWRWPRLGRWRGCRPDGATVGPLPRAV